MRTPIAAAVSLILAGCGHDSAPTTVNEGLAPPVVVTIPPPTPDPPPSPSPPCFKLYESFIYSGEPDLSLLGFAHIDIYDPSHQPDGVLSTDTRNTVLVDWELAGAPLGDAFGYARKSGYRGPLSLYMMIPKRDYWRAQGGPTSAGYKQWQAENDSVKQFVPDVAAIYPSLYTFYPNQDGWVTYATANMAEGRRIAPSKKMYPFLWPTYHSAAGGDLPADYWLKQLRTVRDHADGVVLWGGWDFDHDKARPWDNNTAWWKATQQFIAETNICKE